MADNLALATPYRMFAACAAEAAEDKWDCLSLRLSSPRKFEPLRRTGDHDRPASLGNGRVNSVATATTGTVQGQFASGTLCVGLSDYGERRFGLITLVTP